MAGLAQWSNRQFGRTPFAKGLADHSPNRFAYWCSSNERNHNYTITISLRNHSVFCKNSTRRWFVGHRHDVCDNSKQWSPSFYATRSFDVNFSVTSRRDASSFDLRMRSQTLKFSRPVHYGKLLPHSRSRVTIFSPSTSFEVERTCTQNSLSRAFALGARARSLLWSIERLDHFLLCTTPVASVLIERHCQCHSTPEKRRCPKMKSQNC